MLPFGYRPTPVRLPHFFFPSRLAPIHALLVAYRGAKGAIALSVPTGILKVIGVDRPSDASCSYIFIHIALLHVTPSTTCHHYYHQHHHHQRNGVEGAQSMRSGSGFWAAGHDSGGAEIGAGSSNDWSRIAQGPPSAGAHGGQPSGRLQQQSNDERGDRRNRCRHNARRTSVHGTRLSGV